MKYQILEHTADLKIKAFGRIKEELFENAMLGMQSATRPRIKKKEAETKISITSENLESLFVDFLSEINYLNEINQEIYQGIKFEKFSDREIVAELSGQKVSGFGLQIKGVTFYDLDVHQKEDGTWEATILFDI